MEFARTLHRIKATIVQLVAGDGLRAKATRGGLWVGGANAAEQACRFSRNIILTRLLAPSAFGAMAIVMSSAAIVGSLAEVGLKASVIHNPRGREDAYLNAAWWMGMGRAFLMYAAIFAVAPWVAQFYENTELCALLRVALLGILLDGAMSPRSILPQKNMKFSRWVTISNGGAICGVITTVILGFVFRDVWALAIGYCSENAFRCVLSYILCPGLPSLEWNHNAAKDLLKYSRGAFGLSFLNLIFMRADVFVLGRLYSPTSLGLYSMAILLVQTPSSFIANTLAQVLMPAFSYIQKEKEKVNRVLMKATNLFILLGLPAVAAICMCGSSLLAIVYGTRYAKSAGPLAVASVVVFFNMLNAVITCAFSGLGQPALHRRAVAASAIVMLIAIYPTCKVLGVTGGQVAALMAIMVSYLLQIMRMRGLTGLDLLQYAKSFLPASLMFAGILGICVAARFLGLTARPIGNIAVGILACMTVYALCVPRLLRNMETT